MQSVIKKISTLAAAVIVSLCAVACVPPAEAQTCPSSYNPGALVWSVRNATTGSLRVQFDPYDLDSINVSYAKVVNQYGTVIALLQTNVAAYLDFTLPRGTGTVTLYVGNINRCNIFSHWVSYTQITN